MLDTGFSVNYNNIIFSCLKIIEEHLCGEAHAAGASFFRLGDLADGHKMQVPVSRKEFPGYIRDIPLFIKHIAFVVKNTVCSLLSTEVMCEILRKVQSQLSVETVI